MNAANWADCASAAYLNGQPYVAWTERTTAGNNQVFVKTFTASGWVLVGSGTLNKNSSTGWAYRPNLVADAASGSLYLGWIEQQAMGQRSQTYVSRWNGTAWSALGASLNTDTTLGGAEHVSLAVWGGQPVAAWGEVKFGSLRQVFVKQWNGSNWSLLTGSAKAPSSCDLNSDGGVNVQDVQLGINQALGKITCTSADLQQNGQCYVVDVQRLINAALGGACVIGR
jgi:hypothetical protein